jgi:methylenetetrahydrofolate dehydrogenase (NADP+)/methenyltetrahydrofolate cyclohydrolase
MQLLDGKQAAQAIKEDLKIKVAQMVSQGKKHPHLAAILVGNNGASETYVASKVKTCEELGFKSTLIRFDDQVNEFDLLDQIERLNEDDEIDGILVQLPLPPHISDEKVINTIDPNKDVDGFHPQSAGKMVQGLPTFLPATPYGIMLMLEHYNIPTKGKNAVVIGRSNIVGRPMSVLLSANHPYGNATVTITHSHTTNLEELCKSADIVVAALGNPGFVKESWIKPGAVVIDVGITRVPDASKKSGFRIAGDVDFERVAPKCSWITPVPGGVGLMTIAALMSNTYQACLKKITLQEAEDNN